MSVVILRARQNKIRSGFITADTPQFLIVASSITHSTFDFTALCKTLKMSKALGNKMKTT